MLLNATKSGSLYPCSEAWSTVGEKKYDFVRLPTDKVMISL